MTIWNSTKDLKSLGENGHVEDDFENHQQFPLYEDPLGERKNKHEELIKNKREKIGRYVSID